MKGVFFRFYSAIALFILAGVLMVSFPHPWAYLHLAPTGAAVYLIYSIVRPR